MAKSLHHVKSIKFFASKIKQLDILGVEYEIHVVNGLEGAFLEFDDEEEKDKREALFRIGELVNKELVEEIRQLEERVKNMKES